MWSREIGGGVQAIGDELRESGWAGVVVMPVGDGREGSETGLYFIPNSYLACFLLMKYCRCVI